MDELTAIQIGIFNMQSIEILGITFCSPALISVSPIQVQNESFNTKCIKHYNELHCQWVKINLDRIVKMVCIHTEKNH